MEAEVATKPAIEANKASSLQQTTDSIEQLIEDSHSRAQTNDSKEALDAKNSEKENEEDKDKDTGSKDEQSRPDRPSKRVEEGRRYNNRPRGSFQKKFDKRNVKSDLTSQQESSDPVAIRKQVEFYFSDSNLLQDKFLFTKVEGHKNIPVPIEVIHSFKRMRHFQPLSAVIEALKESTTLDVVENDTCVQRKDPLPEGLEGKPMVEIEKVYEDKSMARSIYAKGFGEEQPSTQFDIEAFFAQYGSTNSVRLRRAYDGTFKGSVFVEFDTEATQKAFLALNPKPKWQAEELHIKSKKQYCDDKVDDIAAGRVRPNEEDRSRYNNRNDKRRRDSPDYDKGRGGEDKDDRDWRVRRDEDRKSGFKDRRDGGHRDSKHSGRGRGGGRGGRGGRDRDRSRDRHHDKTERDERGVPVVRTTSIPDASDEVSPVEEQASLKAKDEEPKATGNGEKAANETTAPPAADFEIEKETSSKKRAREEDDTADAQGTAKKVDVKDEKS